MHCRSGSCAAVVVTLIGVLAVRGEARIRPAAPAAQPAGAVNLPYTVSDMQGNQWLFYQYGQFQHQGNMPVYSQGAML